ncbi:efflux RND transporter periplasmic adaptor subunit [Marinivivus vitaminiproducens]|uniref:efflux RND transporter periplasmic adaptor subunit n=1 Tax=Marinivivus vitaminiproducens TaxID=3035935 RepID=UPI0027A0A2B1|nr:efflux RND transporter periplasmic adaptor subunit [Geminicoccaceae bacterium SCSIO 64248]
MSERRRRRVVASSLLAGLVLFGLNGCGDQADGAAESAAAPTPQVTVATPLVQPITEYDEFTGRFETTAGVEVRARVSGYLQSIDFTDGQLVEQGDLLFTIDPRPYEAALDQARAQLQSAQARIELARSELDRARELVGRENISRSVFDQRTQEMRAAEAAVLEATATRRDAELDLEWTQVRAPIGGRISSRRVDTGNLVTGDPNATLLTTIVALDPIYFVFDMSEGDFLAYQRAVAENRLPSTRNNETLVDLHLPDREDWAYSGRIDFVDNRIDMSSGTIRVRAVVPNGDHFLTPGQFGRVRIPGSLEYEAVLVPESAITTDQSSKLVMTVAADGTVAPKIIRPGPTYPGGLRIVREGIGPDDRIIINGLMRARPGVKVQAQEGTIEPEAVAAQN